nr:FtsW/RodA/SpoVE family cell cycle protein [Paenibacillus sp. Marseille-Q4541]
MDQVCSHIKAKKMRPEIREELKNHIEERMEVLQLSGNSQATSALTAIDEMGSPDLIGRSLNDTHKPLLNWKLLLLVVFISLIGVLGASSIQVSGSSMISDLIPRKSTQMVISFLFLIGFYFFDYIKLQKYSNDIFLVVLFMNVVVLSQGEMINGVKGFLALGPISINMLYVSVLLLLLALAGMKPIKQMGWKGIIFQLGYRGVIPLSLFTYIGNSVLYGGMYLAGFIMITWLTKKNAKQFIVFTVISSLAMFYFMIPHLNTLKERFLTYLDPVGEIAYLQMKTMEVIRSAGWFGHGFASNNPNLLHVQSDSLFPYLIYCFGWSFGLITIILIGLFLAYVAQLLFQIQESYGKQLVYVVVFFFSLRFIWPVFMAFGWLPFVSMELPFIGYGGSNQFIDSAAIGLILSIYRQKNMIPDPAFDTTKLSS